MTTFISYSRVNSDFAVRLAQDLKLENFDVWLDQLDIPAGTRWDDEIEKALESSTTFLIVLSPESIQSQNVKDEIGYAIDAGKHILPVVIQNCKVPFRLRRFQHVDFTGKPYDQSLVKIKYLLGNTRALVDVKKESQPQINDDVVQEKSSVHRPKSVDMGGSNPVKSWQRWNPRFSIIIASIILLIMLAVLFKDKFIATGSIPTISTTLTETKTATPTEYLTVTPIIVGETSTEPPITPSTLTFTPTLENTATASPSPEPKVDKMTVILQSTVDEGKAPLRVNFNARTSYVQFADSTMIPCGVNRLCSYVFTIYRDSKITDTVNNNDGVLSYTFGGKGQYFVAVCVCRGDACNDDGVTITVK